LPRSIASWIKARKLAPNTRLRTFHRPGSNRPGSKSTGIDPARDHLPEQCSGCGGGAAKPGPRCERDCLAEQRVVYGLLFRSCFQTCYIRRRSEASGGADRLFSAILSPPGARLCSSTPTSTAIVSEEVVSRRIDPGGFRPGDDYFLPVKVLSRVFRGKFLALIQDAMERGKIQVPDSEAKLRDPVRWRALVTKTLRTRVGCLRQATIRRTGVRS